MTIPGTFPDEGNTYRGWIIRFCLAGDWQATICFDDSKQWLFAHTRAELIAAIDQWIEENGT